MIVRFEDRNGEVGEVTGDLSVDYDGEWEREIRAFVDEVVEGFRLDGGVATEEALEELVLELPEIPPVVRAERRHD